MSEEIVTSEVFKEMEKTIHSLRELNKALCGSLIQAKEVVNLVETILSDYDAELFWSEIPKLKEAITKFNGADNA